MDITQILPFLNDLPEPAHSFVSNLLLFAVAILVIWILRVVITRLVMVPARNLAARTTNSIDDRTVGMIERPIRILVIAIGIMVVTTFFQFNPELERVADSIARAFLLASVVFFVYNIIDYISITTETLHGLTGISIEDRLLPFLRVVVKVFVVLMGALIIIQEFGYDATGLIASFGVVGLAFSLAAQDTAANVFGFTAIVSDNPFKVGDYIATGDFAGHVEHVGVRSTRVRKLDQSLVIVPNSKLTDAAVTNWSRLTKRRLDFHIGLTYSTSSAKMRDVLEKLREMLKARSTIDPTTVVVHFVQFGGSSLDIRIIAYILIADWTQYTAEVEQINLDIMGIVESCGLSFAFPSHSIYLETMPNPVDTSVNFIPQPVIKDVANPSFVENETASSTTSDDDVR